MNNTILNGEDTSTYSDILPTFRKKRRKRTSRENIKTVTRREGSYVFTNGVLSFYPSKSISTPLVKEELITEIYDDKLTSSLDSFNSPYKHDTIAHTQAEFVTYPLLTKHDHKVVSSMVNKFGNDSEDTENVSPLSYQYHNVIDQSSVVISKVPPTSSTLITPVATSEPAPNVVTSSSDISGVYPSLVTWSYVTDEHGFVLAKRGSPPPMSGAFSESHKDIPIHSFNANPYDTSHDIQDYDYEDYVRLYAESHSDMIYTEIPQSSDMAMSTTHSHTIDHPLFYSTTTRKPHFEVVSPDESNLLNLQSSDSLYTDAYLPLSNHDLSIVNENMEASIKEFNVIDRIEGIGQTDNNFAYVEASPSRNESLQQEMEQSMNTFQPIRENSRETVTSGNSGSISLDELNQSLTGINLDIGSVVSPIISSNEEINISNDNNDDSKYNIGNNNEQPMYAMIYSNEYSGTTTQITNDQEDNLHNLEIVGYPGFPSLETQLNPSYMTISLTQNDDSLNIPVEILNISISLIPTEPTFLTSHIAVSEIEKQTEKVVPSEMENLNNTISTIEISGEQLNGFMPDGLLLNNHIKTTVKETFPIYDNVSFDSIGIAASTSGENFENNNLKHNENIFSTQLEENIINSISIIANHHNYEDALKSSPAHLLDTTHHQQAMSHIAVTEIEEQTEKAVPSKMENLNGAINANELSEKEQLSGYMPEGLLPNGDIKTKVKETFPLYDVSFDSIGTASPPGDTFETNNSKLNETVFSTQLEENIINSIFTFANHHNYEDALKSPPAHSLDTTHHQQTTTEIAQPENYTNLLPFASLGSLFHSDYESDENDQYEFVYDYSNDWFDNYGSDNSQPNLIQKTDKIPEQSDSYVKRGTVKHWNGYSESSNVKPILQQTLGSSSAEHLMIIHSSFPMRNDSGVVNSIDSNEENNVQHKYYNKAHNKKIKNQHVNLTVNSSAESEITVFSDETLKVQNLTNAPNKTKQYILISSSESVNSSDNSAVTPEMFLFRNLNESDKRRLFLDIIPMTVFDDKAVMTTKPSSNSRRKRDNIANSDIELISKETNFKNTNTNENYLPQLRSSLYPKNGKSSFHEKEVTMNTINHTVSRPSKSKDFRQGNYNKIQDNLNSILSRNILMTANTENTKSSKQLVKHTAVNDNIIMNYEITDFIIKEKFEYPFNSTSEIDTEEVITESILKNSENISHSLMNLSAEYPEYFYHDYHEDFAYLFQDEEDINEEYYYNPLKVNFNSDNSNDLNVNEAVNKKTHRINKQGSSEMLVPSYSLLTSMKKSDLSTRHFRSINDRFLMQPLTSVLISSDVQHKLQSVTPSVFIYNKVFTKNNPFRSRNTNENYSTAYMSNHIHVEDKSAGIYHSSRIKNDGIHLPNDFEDEIRKLYQQLELSERIDIPEELNSEAYMQFSSPPDIFPSYDETTFYSVNVKPSLTSFAPLLKYTFTHNLPSNAKQIPVSEVLSINTIVATSIINDFDNIKRGNNYLTLGTSLPSFTTVLEVATELLPAPSRANYISKKPSTQNIIEVTEHSFNENIVDNTTLNTLQYSVGGKTNHSNSKSSDNKIGKFGNGTENLRMELVGLILDLANGELFESVDIEDIHKMLENKSGTLADNITLFENSDLAQREKISSNESEYAVALEAWASVLVDFLLMEGQDVKQGDLEKMMQQPKFETMKDVIMKASSNLTFDNPLKPSITQKTSSKLKTAYTAISKIYDTTDEIFFHSEKAQIVPAVTFENYSMTTYKLNTITTPTREQSSSVAFLEENTGDNLHTDDIRQTLSPAKPVTLTKRGPTKYFNGHEINKSLLDEPTKNKETFFKNNEHGDNISSYDSIELHKLAYQLETIEDMLNLVLSHTFSLKATSPMVADVSATSPSVTLDEGISFADHFPSSFNLSKELFTTPSIILTNSSFITDNNGIIYEAVHNSHGITLQPVKLVENKIQKATGNSNHIIVNKPETSKSQPPQYPRYGNTPGEVNLMNFSSKESDTEDTETTENDESTTLNIFEIRSELSTTMQSPVSTVLQQINEYTETILTNDKQFNFVKDVGLIPMNNSRKVTQLALLLLDEAFEKLKNEFQNKSNINPAELLNVHDYISSIADKIKDYCHNRSITINVLLEGNDLPSDSAKHDKSQHNKNDSFFSTWYHLNESGSTAPIHLDTLGNYPPTNNIHSTYINDVGTHSTLSNRHKYINPVTENIKFITDITSRLPIRVSSIKTNSINKDRPNTFDNLFSKEQNSPGKYFGNYVNDSAINMYDTSSPEINPYSTRGYLSYQPDAANIQLSPKPLISLAEQSSSHGDNSDSLPYINNLTPAGQNKNIYNNKRPIINNYLQLTTRNNFYPVLNHSSKQDDKIASSTTINEAHITTPKSSLPHVTINSFNSFTNFPHISLQNTDSPSTHLPDIGVINSDLLPELIIRQNRPRDILNKLVATDGSQDTTPSSDENTRHAYSANFGSNSVEQQILAPDNLQIYNYPGHEYSENQAHQSPLDYIDSFETEGHFDNINVFQDISKDTTTTVNLLSDAGNYTISLLDDFGNNTQLLQHHLPIPKFSENSLIKILNNSIDFQSPNNIDLLEFYQLVTALRKLNYRKHNVDHETHDNKMEEKAQYLPPKSREDAIEILPDTFEYNQQRRHSGFSAFKINKTRGISDTMIQSDMYKIAPQLHHVSQLQTPHLIGSLVYELPSKRPFQLPPRILTPPQAIRDMLPRDRLAYHEAAGEICFCVSLSVLQCLSEIEVTTMLCTYIKIYKNRKCNTLYC